MPTRTLVASTLLAASLAASLAPAPAAVAAPRHPALTSPFTLSLQLWDCYVPGDGAPAGATITVSLLRDGALVASTKGTADGGGGYAGDFCAKPKGRVRPGDTITVFRTRDDRKTFSVPDVQPRIDVVGGSASGTTPAGSITITPKNCASRQLCLSGIGKVLLGGDWSEPLGGDAGSGGDLLDLTWSGGGMSVRSSMPVPYFAAKAGSSRITGAATPGQKVSVILRTKGGRIRATGTARANGPNGGFTVTLRHNGSKVKVRTGDRLRSTVYVGAKLRMVPAGLSIDGATGHVTGHCFKESSKVLAEARKGLASVTDSLFTALDTSFLLDASGLGLPLGAGTKATARCANDQGNELLLAAKLG